jgi:hypothetical protein
MFKRHAVVIAVAMLPLLAAPGSAQQQRAIPNNLFTASGFEVRFADNPERIAMIRALPPNKLVMRVYGGKTYYVYADHGCNCAFVGTAEAYRVYQQGGPSGMQFGGGGSNLPRYNTREMEVDMRESAAPSQPGASPGMDFIFRGAR